MILKIVFIIGFYFGSFISADSHAETRHQAPFMGANTPTQVGVKSFPSLACSVLDYFPSDPGQKLNFSGSAEYGHQVTVNKRLKVGKKVVIQMTGRLGEALGGKPVRYEYHLTQKSAKERFHKGAKEYFSPIQDLTILTGDCPFKKGASWTQTFKLKNGSFTLTSTLSELKDQTMDSLLVVTAEVSLPGNTPLDFFGSIAPDLHAANRSKVILYKEVRWIKKGLGVVRLEKFYNDELLTSFFLTDMAKAP